MTPLQKLIDNLSQLRKITYRAAGTVTRTDMQKTRRIRLLEQRRHEILNLTRGITAGIDAEIRRTRAALPEGTLPDDAGGRDTAHPQ